MQAELCWEMRLPVFQPERAGGNSAGKTWRKPNVVKCAHLEVEKSGSVHGVRIWPR